MIPCLYLNGEIQSLAEARLDPLDRGNLFGDALYEAVKVQEGVLLHFAPHHERLAAGLARVQIPLPDDLEQISSAVLEASGLESGYLYLQVSRGVLSRVLIPPRGLEPTVMVVPFELEFDPPAGRTKRVTTVQDWRWRFRDIKTTALMATVLGKLEARTAGTDEILFIGPDGQLREGGTTNFFVRRGDRLLTHPADGSILRGVTRATVIELATDAGLPVVEEAPRLERIIDWQEAFLTGTTTGVQPVVEIDGQTVGDAKSGEWTRRLGAALDRLERDLIATATVSP